MAKLEKSPPVLSGTNRHIFTPQTVPSPFLKGTVTVESGPLAVIENSVPQVKAFRHFAAGVVGLMAFLPACVMLVAEMIFKSLRWLLFLIPQFFSFGLDSNAVLSLFRF